MKPEDHRILRARERYGIELTRDHIHELERRVCADNCFRKQDGGGVHVLVWDGQALVAGVIYNRDPPAICTFLPPDFFSSGRHSSWVSLSKARRRKIKKQRAAHV